MIEYCKNKTDDYDLIELKQICKKATSECDFVTCCLFLWTFYTRENCVGPSIYTEYVEETRAPLIKGGPLPVTPFDPISNKNEKLQELLLSNYEKDGEPFYHKAQFLIVLFALDCCLES